MILWISSGQFVTFHSYFCNSGVSILPKLFIKKYLIHQLRWRSDCILTGHPGERPGGKAFALGFLFSGNPNCRRLDSSRPVLFHLGSKQNRTTEFTSLTSGVSVPFLNALRSASSPSSAQVNS